MGFARPHTPESPTRGAPRLSRPEFDRAYGRIAVSYSVEPLGDRSTRLRANACVERADAGIGLRRIAFAAGDKIMAGRQLRTLRSLAEAV